MLKTKRCFMLLLIMAAISSSAAFSVSTAYADEVTVAEEVTVPEEIPSEEEIPEIDSITHEDIDDDSLTADEKADEMTSYKERTLTIDKAKFVADTFKGVQALYRPGKNDGSNATYSCAAYIKKFYNKVYGVSVYNLFSGSTPRTYEGSAFKSVQSPKAGDIARSGTHWAIVKKVDKSSNKVVLIEQNWKWSQGGQTVCKVNRSVGIDKLSYYRLETN